MLLRMRGEDERDCLRPEVLRFCERQFSFLADNGRIEGGGGDVLSSEDHAVSRVECRRKSIVP